MTLPWETKLEDDIPGFLRRIRMPDGTVVIGLENVNHVDNPPTKDQSLPPPWASTN